MTFNLFIVKKYVDIILLALFRRLIDPGYRSQLIISYGKEGSKVIIHHIGIIPTIALSNSLCSLDLIPTNWQKLKRKDKRLRSLLELYVITLFFSSIVPYLISRRQGEISHFIIYVITPFSSTGISARRNRTDMISVSRTVWRVGFFGKVNPSTMLLYVIMLALFLSTKCCFTSVKVIHNTYLVPHL